MSIYVRYAVDGKVSYGELVLSTVHAIEGGLFGSRKYTGVFHDLAQVKLLYPCEPSKVLCVGLNYKSHLDGRPAPANPEIFYKPVSALQNPGDPIKTPLDSVNMHFEGELVVVMGEGKSIFGVTCGNDVSERDWQRGPNKDLQWWRAKGSDTFGPLGPAIVTDLDFTNLKLESRLNGKVMQQQTTADLLFDVPRIIDYISKWVTLQPGDVIYTGTPGATCKMNPGDVLEVEIEKVGLLSNPIT